MWYLGPSPTTGAFFGSLRLLKRPRPWVLAPSAKALGRMPRVRRMVGCLERFCLLDVMVLGCLGFCLYLLGPLLRLYLFTFWHYSQSYILFLMSRERILTLIERCSGLGWLKMKVVVLFLFFVFPPRQYWGIGYGLLLLFSWILVCWIFRFSTENLQRMHRTLWWHVVSISTNACRCRFWGTKRHVTSSSLAEKDS